MSKKRQKAPPKKKQIKETVISWNWKMKTNKNNTCSMRVFCKKHPSHLSKQPREPQCLAQRLVVSNDFPHILFPIFFAVFADGCTSCSPYSWERAERARMVLMLTWADWQVESSWKLPECERRHVRLWITRAVGLSARMEQSPSSQVIIAVCPTVFVCIILWFRGWN